MKTVFLTETNFRGKWTNTMPNARTEIAWQVALNADHYWIGDFQHVTGYDLVVVIFPKGGVSLNSEGIQLDNKKVIGEVAKVSGQLRLQYANSPKLIASAVVQTKKLGITLEQAAKAANSLLDFESSIENELSAELLTGKSLNLERARGLALNGDAAGAAAEMAKQIGTAAEFSQMNVLQQEQLAKAVGMSADELLRLKQITGVAALFANKDFSDSWEVDENFEFEEEDKTPQPPVKKGGGLGKQPEPKQNDKPAYTGKIPDTIEEVKKALIKPEADCHYYEENEDDFDSCPVVKYGKGEITIHCGKCKYKG